jgi:hypothetical protein
VSDTRGGGVEGGGGEVDWEGESEVDREGEMTAFAGEGRGAHESRLSGERNRRHV